MVFHGIYFQISRTRRSKLVAELFCFIFVSCPAQDPKICDEIRRLLDYGAMNDFVQKLLVWVWIRKQNFVLNLKLIFSGLKHEAKRSTGTIRWK